MITQSLSMKQSLIRQIFDGRASAPSPIPNDADRPVFRLSGPGCDVPTRPDTHMDRRLAVRLQEPRLCVIVGHDEASLGADGRRCVPPLKRKTLLTAIPSTGKHPSISQ